VLLALVCRLAADNDAARVVDLLTRPRAPASCITRSVFNVAVRRLLAGSSTAAAANVALLAGRYWTICSARVLRALLLALAAQPLLLHGGSFVASSFSSVADLLRSHVPPLLAVQDPVFDAKNAAATLRCSVTSKVQKLMLNSARQSDTRGVCGCRFAALNKIKDSRGNRQHLWSRCGGDGIGSEVSPAIDCG
jgi:hypothetical protein